MSVYSTLSIEWILTHSTQLNWMHQLYSTQLNWVERNAWVWVYPYIHYQTANIIPYFATFENSWEKLIIRANFWVIQGLTASHDPKICTRDDCFLKSREWKTINYCIFKLVNVTSLAIFKVTFSIPPSHKINCGKAIREKWWNSGHQQDFFSIKKGQRGHSWCCMHT